MVVSDQAHVCVACRLAHGAAGTGFRTIDNAELRPYLWIGIAHPIGLPRACVR